MSMGYIYAISKYNKITNYTLFARFASAVYIRLGFRGINTAAITEDPCFETNYLALLGKTKLGLFFATNAINDAEAVEEAEAIIAKIKNHKFDLPVFIQSGYGNHSKTGRADNLTKSSRTEILVKIIDTLAKAGVDAGIYAEESWFNEMLDPNRIHDVKKWVIKYSTKIPFIDPMSSVTYWQKEKNTVVNGVTGFVSRTESIDVPLPEIKTKPAPAPKKEAPVKKEAEKKPVKEVASKTVVDKTNAKKGASVHADGAKLYRTSAAKEVQETISGDYFIADPKIIKNRIRISETKKGDVIGWAEVSDLSIN